MDDDETLDPIALSEEMYETTYVVYQSPDTTRVAPVEAGMEEVEFGAEQCPEMIDPYVTFMACEPRPVPQAQCGLPVGHGGDHYTPPLYLWPEPSI